MGKKIILLIPAVKTLAKRTLKTMKRVERCLRKGRIAQRAPLRALAAAGSSCACDVRTSAGTSPCVHVCGAVHRDVTAQRLDSDDGDSVSESSPLLSSENCNLWSVCYDDLVF